MPEGWRWGDVASLVTDISSGKSFKCDERPPNDGEVGVVKVSAVTWGIYDERESKTCTRQELINPKLFVRQGDFLFSRANTIDLVGSCVIADRVSRNIMLSDKILRFTVLQGWERWLLWVLRSRHGRAEIERLATGNQESMRNIGQSRVLEIRIPLPAVGEHQRVVEEIDSYFSRLDAATSALRRVERNLKRYRASVLKSAVEGRLVPTEAALAKQEGRDYEPASALLDRVLAERRRRWSESGKKGKYQEPAPPDTSNLPPLPEGWCWATVEQIASPEPGSIQSGPFGSALLHSEFTNEGNLVIGIDNVQDGHFSKGSGNRISPEKYAALQKFSARAGDVLITVMATVGRTCVVPDDLESAIISKHVYRISPDSSIVLSGFLHLCLWGAPIVRAQMFSQVQGQTRPGLNGSIIKRLIIPLAPLFEQHRIVREAERILSLEVSALVEVARIARMLTRLRQCILKAAFEGKLADQDLFEESSSALLSYVDSQPVASEILTGPHSQALHSRGTDT